MVLDIGVLEKSERFYFEPDRFTEDNLFYVPHAGVYECDKTYEVQRSYLDTCQIIMVDSGNLTVEYRGQKLIAKAGDLVMLDCREPHKYYATSRILKIRWFHYLGNCSNSYTKLITEAKGFVISDNFSEVEECCERIIMSLRKKNPVPHVLSSTVHKFLALLTIVSKDKEKTELELLLESSVEFMEDHFNDTELSVDILAEKISISSSYYMKRFKEYHGVTPYKYLKTIRLRKSKEMLTTTRNSIEDIAIECGFCNPSHFIMAFKKDTQMTPLQYRTLWR